MAATACSTMASNGLVSFSFFPQANAKANVPISFFPFNHWLKPKFDCISVQLKPPRFGSSHEVKAPSEYLFRVPIASCLLEDRAGVFPESRDPSISSNSSKDAVIDIKLPRRSLLIKFTCNACGARSQKCVNRLAYERGTVFVQETGMQLSSLKIKEWKMKGSFLMRKIGLMTVYL